MCVRACVRVCVWVVSVILEVWGFLCGFIRVCVFVCIVHDLQYMFIRMLSLHVVCNYTLYIEYSILCVRINAFM